MPSVGVELESRLGQGGTLYAELGWKFLGLSLFFLIGLALAHVRMHSRTEMDCLRLSWAQALGGRTCCSSLLHAEKYPEQSLPLVCAGE